MKNRKDRKRKDMISHRVTSHATVGISSRRVRHLLVISERKAEKKFGLGVNRFGPRFFFSTGHLQRKLGMAGHAVRSDKVFNKITTPTFFRRHRQVLFVWVSLVLCPFRSESVLTLMTKHGQPNHHDKIFSGQDEAYRHRRGEEEEHVGFNARREVVERR